DVAEILREHVTLEVERIDRMHLNIYMPALQRAEGLASSVPFLRGHQLASGSPDGSPLLGHRRQTGRLVRVMNDGPASPQRELLEDTKSAKTGLEGGSTAWYGFWYGDSQDHDHAW